MVASVAFIVGGLIFLAYALGKFVVITKKQMQAVAASGLAGILVFILVDVQQSIVKLIFNR